jgi:flagellin-like protein
MEEEERKLTGQKTVQKFRKNAKAISPLIATLLLIAIAVAASVITYSWVMSMIGSQSQQAQTQVRIDSVTWNVTENTVATVVRNTGSVPASIETVSVRESASGSTWHPEAVSHALDTGATGTVTWDGDSASPTLSLSTSTSYVIRVTCSTGFYYEMTAVSPSA